MTAVVHSATAVGFDGHLIEVECDMANGLPSLQIVGLGNKAIDEAKERVRSAIKNSGLTFPAKRITINLAPANLPKNGAHFDLPIALAVLAVSGQLQIEALKDKLFAGELALNGNLRPIRGAINIAETAVAKKIKSVVLPAGSVSQARLVEDVEAVPAINLKDVVLWLNTNQPMQIDSSEKLEKSLNSLKNVPSLGDIHGQNQAKRALIIAAAGHHNILFSGSPGAGKTMMAKALTDLLPPLQDSEIISVTKLHSLAGEVEESVITARPFRAPHHTASYISLVGGGKDATPGEISLAHHGVLFLDELPEYPRASLESLRQPLEDRNIRIARANTKVSYPANFMLVATQNPCPCGYYGDSNRACTCSPHQILLYQKRISGPLLDRIDLTVAVARVEHQKLLAANKAKNEHVSAKQQIANARKRQETRYKNLKTNASLTNQDIKKYLNIEPQARQLLDTAAQRLDLTARSYFKVIKVAQTIADLENSDQISPLHISEALQYRFKR